MDEELMKKYARFIYKENEIKPLDLRPTIIC